MAGIYAPRTGTVEMGGAELARMPAENVRTQVALVNQEHHVFVGTLRDNLLLAKPDADDAELDAALAVGRRDAVGRDRSSRAWTPRSARAVTPSRRARRSRWRSRA